MAEINQSVKIYQILYVFVNKFVFAGDLEQNENLLRKYFGSRFKG